MRRKETGIMSLNQKMWLNIAVLAVGLFFTIAGYKGILEGVGLFLLMVGFILNIFLIRCPKCGAWLGKYPGDYCKNCGGKIEWKKGSKE